MRRKPVAFVLIDAAFLADVKWRNLRRRLPDPAAFNSAVGCWLVALTAARRNGEPCIDVAEEAEDGTYVADLVAVGLLTPDGFPPHSFAEWAPARPKFPSDAPAPSAPNVPNAPKVASAKSSPPLPSIQGSSSEGVQGEPDAAVEFQVRTGEFPGDKFREWLNDLAQTHGEARLVAAIRATPKTQRSGRDYLIAVRDQLRAEDHRAERAEADAERARNAAKRAPLVSPAVAQLRDALLAKEQREVPA